MAERFQFFNPIGKTSAAQLTPNLPFGLGAIDQINSSKNIPHFEELAANFGLQNAKAIIRQFPPEPTGKDSIIKAVSTSVFGFPVFSNLDIRSGSYNDNQGKIIGTYDTIRLEAVLFEINRESNLVVTDIQGRDNSVIEYISKKSWKINCKGRIMSNNRNVYPRTDVDNFIKAMDSTKSLQVDSWYLNMAGIFNIVIQKKSFPQEEGSIEYQKFEFDAIADFPIILKIQK